MGRARVVVAAGLAALAACVDVDGLTGAGASDGGDGGDDGASPEGGPADAGADAAADASDGGPFCAHFDPPPLFCADFDDGPTSLDVAHWAGRSFNPKDGGTLALDPTAYASPPASLLATFFGAPSGGGASLSTALVASSPASLHVAFAVRTNVAPAQNTVVVVIQFGAAYGIDVMLADGFAALNEAVASDGGTSYHQHAFAAQPQTGVWSTIAVDVSFDTRKLTATLDGFVAVDDTIRVGAQTGPVSLTVGVEYSASTGTESFNLDDIVVSSP